MRGGRDADQGAKEEQTEALIAWFRGLGFGLERIGLEAGPMSKAVCGDAAAGLAVEL